MSFLDRIEYVFFLDNVTGKKERCINECFYKQQRNRQAAQKLQQQSAQKQLCDEESAIFDSLASQ